MDSGSVDILVRVPGAAADLLQEQVDEIIIEALAKLDRQTRNEALQALERSRLLENKRTFFAKAPIVFHTYRKTKPFQQHAGSAYRHVSELFDIHPVGIEALVSMHRRKINSYMRARRHAYILRAVIGGTKIAAVARALGCTRRTIHRHLNQVKASSFYAKNPRYLAMLCLRLKGVSNHKIAAQMGCSYRTVMRALAPTKRWGGKVHA